MILVGSSGAYSEVTLKMDHFVLDKLRLQHGNGGFLEGMASAAVEVTTARANTKPQSA